MLVRVLLRAALGALGALVGDWVLLGKNETVGTIEGDGALLEGVGALVGATLGDLVTLEPWQWPWEPW
jgi:hypothetical protein